MPAVGRERLDIDELRYFVRQSLPDYMVPSVYLPVEEFPLTPNQKIDRQALPKPDETRTGRGERTAAPGSEVETVVATIMAALLRVDRLGIYDNFFDLGGHSLLAAQLLARLQKALGVEISLRHLFESPTVDGLVAAMFEDSTQRQTIEKRARIVARLLQLPEDEASALLQHKRGDA
jgi:acyl carrier protein